MKHYDDTGELGNSVVGDPGGYGGSGEYCVSIGSGESSDAGDTGYTGESGDSEDLVDLWKKLMTFS